MSKSTVLCQAKWKLVTALVGIWMTPFSAYTQVKDGGAESQRHQKIAFVIGNDAYASPLKKTRSSAGDIRKIVDLLLQSGWRKENVIHHVNIGSERLKEEISRFDALLEKRVPQGVRKVAFVYISGRSAVERRDRTGEQTHFLAVDASLNPAKIEEEGISIEEVARRLGGIAPGSGMMIVNLCESGKASLNRNSKVSEGHSPSATASSPLVRNVDLLWACRPGSEAFEDRKSKGDTSRFVDVLAKHLADSSLTVREALRKTKTALENDDTDWYYSPEYIIYSQNEYRAFGRLDVETASPVIQPENSNGSEGQTSQLPADDRYASTLDAHELLDEALRRNGSIDTIRRLADEGDRIQQYHYGVALLLGRHAKKDLILSRDYIQRSARQGFERARYAYANFLIEGVGGAKDAEQGLSQLEDLARARFGPAMIRLARQLAYHANPERRDVRRAMALLEDAGNAMKLPDALVYLSEMRMAGLNGNKDVQVGLEDLLRAEKSRSAKAAEHLAYLYRWGLHVKRDPRQALKHYSSAIELGSETAAIQAAKLLTYDGEHEPDLPQAMKFLKQAPDSAQAASASLQVIIFLKNRSLFPANWNYKEVASKAAEAGEIDGLVALVQSLMAGSDGVPKDVEAAGMLAESGYRIYEAAPRDSEAAWPMNGYILAQSRLAMHLRTDQKMPSKEYFRLRDIWGLRKENASLNTKYFNVPANCGGLRTNLKLYVWEPNAKVIRRSPTEEQAEWYQRVRGCTVEKSVVDGFNAIFKHANDNGISFSRLADFAVSHKESSASNDRKAGSMRSLEGDREAVDAINSTGLLGIFSEIADYERSKPLGTPSRAGQMPAEEAVDRLLVALSSVFEAPAESTAECRTIRAFPPLRTKAGAKALNIPVDLNCNGRQDAIIRIPEPENPSIVLTIQSKEDTSTPTGTRYFLRKGRGVERSFHDLFGNRQPTAYGYHQNGSGEPTMTFPVIAR